MLSFFFFPLLRVSSSGCVAGEQEGGVARGVGGGGWCGGGCGQQGQALADHRCQPGRQAVLQCRGDWVRHLFDEMLALHLIALASVTFPKFALCSQCYTSAAALVVSIAFRL